MKIKFETSIPNIELIIDTRKLEKELINALKHTVSIIKDDYKRTVRTWSKQPMFVRRGPKKIFGRLEETVSTESEIYFYIDDGTSPHIIRPRQAGLLSFRTGYRAKTRVGVVGSRAGGAFGPRVSAKQVMHPGFPARNFTKTIAKRRQKNLVNLVRLAFNRSFRFGGM